MSLGNVCLQCFESTRAFVSLSSQSCSSSYIIKSSGVARSSPQASIRVFSNHTQRASPFLGTCNLCWSDLKHPTSSAFSSSSSGWRGMQYSTPTNVSPSYDLDANFRFELLDQSSHNILVRLLFGSFQSFRNVVTTQTPTLITLPRTPSLWGRPDAKTFLVDLAARPCLPKSVLD